MKSLRRKRLVYSLVLELCADISLISAYLLGARQWMFFVVTFLLGKVFGVATTMYYWHLQDKTLEENLR
jgi:hypothetical protein